MNTGTILGKLLRIARKNDLRAKDENLDGVARATAAMKRDNAEREAFSLLYNPHAVKNAQVEASRQKQLVSRKSTAKLSEKAHAKREENAANAERDLQALAAQGEDMLRSGAYDLIEIAMGRKKVEMPVDPEAATREMARVHKESETTVVGS